MPVYEYKCNECEHKFDDTYRIDDRQTPCKNPCPNCGKVAVEQLISACYGVVDARMNVRATGEFRDVMQKIKGAHKYDKKANLKDY